MRYNVRDLLGHFVKPKRAEGRMCPHPCCQGRRPHPDRFPLMLPRDVLREMSDEDLVRHLGKPTVGESGEAVTQAVSELQRREDKQLKAAAARDRAKDRYRSRQTDYRTWLEGQWIAAETATRGNMVNKRGRARGVDPRSLWTSNDRTRAAYASEELRQYWDANPILSSREFAAGGEIAGNRRRRSTSLYGVY